MEHAQASGRRPRCIRQPERSRSAALCATDRSPSHAFVDRLPIGWGRDAADAAIRSRSGGHALAAARDEGDATCEYWRYCALDGFLCTCCGGSLNACPPGAQVSKVTWIGTCQHPKDNKAYLISYNDCCGKTACNQCLCNYNVGERPGYRMGVHNDINWCMTNQHVMYHCTLAAVVGTG